jgi:hypothetical protein
LQELCKYIYFFCPDDKIDKTRSQRGFSPRRLEKGMRRSVEEIDRHAIESSPTIDPTRVAFNESASGVYCLNTVYTILKRCSSRNSGNCSSSFLSGERVQKVILDPVQTEGSSSKEVGEWWRGQTRGWIGSQAIFMSCPQVRKLMLGEGSTIGFANKSV